MSMLWIVLAIVGGCLIGVYLGILAMCLFAIRHSSEEQAAWILRERAGEMSEVGEIQSQPVVS